MRLFQYWDTGSPPEEVAGWIEGFRAANSGMKHRLYDRASASAFIGRRVGERERRAFDALAVPAMQADYFRLCAMWAVGGVWVDADYQSKAPLKKLLRQAEGTLLQFWHGHIVTGVILAREPGDAFLRACLDLATVSIEARAPQSAYMSTGPGVLNAVRVMADPAAFDEVLTQYRNIGQSVGDFGDLLDRARATTRVTPELEAAFKALTLIEVTAMKPWIAWKKPAYKQTGRHWQNWTGPQYFDPPTA